MLNNIWKKSENMIVLRELKWDFKVPDFIAIWDWDFSDKLNKICEKFKWKKVAVRSSSSTEDTDNDSKAGAFETILNVEVNKKLLTEAYGKIQAHALEKFWHGIPVLVQEMVKDIHYSWVVFSKDPDTNKDYVVINYHSWIWEDLVSWNSSWKVIKYFSENISEKDVFSKLAKIVKEISLKYWKEVDVEFAIDKNNNIYLLQLRPITTIDWLWKVDKVLKRYVSYLTTVIEKNNLYLWDMIDVNPQELVGNQPYLIKTFFDYLFVKGVLKDSRKDFWYSYEEFWVFVLDKYYIDLSKNLTSFLPSSLTDEERELFIDYYKDLVWNDISLQKQLDSIYYPINIEQVIKVVSEFKIFDKEKEAIVQKFKIFFEQLEGKLSLLTQNYKENEQEIFKKLWIENYYDLVKLNDVDLSLNEILELIKLTARYFVDYARWSFYFSSLQKSNPDFFKANHYFSSIVSGSNEDIVKFINVEWFNFLNLLNQEIDVKLLKKQWYWKKFNWKNTGLDVFLIWRENFKFIFMNLFRLLAQKIEKHEDIEYMDFNDLINWKKNWNKILHNRKKEELSDLLLMPPVLEKDNNVSYISKFDAKWFFIWEWFLEWDLVYIDDLSKIDKKKINWKILLLENATPEIDIYLPYIKWIITKNWWPLAHIAIRARELKVPAVVWIWKKFDDLMLQEKIMLDFESEKLI